MPNSDSTSGKSTGQTVGELWQLLQAYARQETIDPLKDLGRYLAYGAVGSVLLGLGVVFTALAGLRALQTETDVFDGGWSFVPYLVVAVAMVVVVALAVRGVARASSSTRRQEP